MSLWTLVFIGELTLGGNTESCSNMTRTHCCGFANNTHGLSWRISAILERNTCIHLTQPNGDTSVCSTRVSPSTKWTLEERKLTVRSERTYHWPVTTSCSMFLRHRGSRSWSFTLSFHQRTSCRVIFTSLSTLNVQANPHEALLS